MLPKAQRTRGLSVLANVTVKLSYILQTFWGFSGKEGAVFGSNVPLVLLINLINHIWAKIGYARNAKSARAQTC